MIFYMDKLCTVNNVLFINKEEINKNITFYCWDNHQSIIFLAILNLLGNSGRMSFV